MFSAVWGHKEYQGHQRNTIFYFYLDRSDLQYFIGGVSQERKIGQMKNIILVLEIPHDRLAVVLLVERHSAGALKDPDTEEFLSETFISHGEAILKLFLDVGEGSIGARGQQNVIDEHSHEYDMVIDAVNVEA